MEDKNKQKIEKVRGALHFEMSINTESGEMQPFFPKPPNEQQAHLGTLGSLMFAFQMVQSTMHANESRLILTGHAEKNRKAQVALEVLGEMMRNTGKNYLASKKTKAEQNGSMKVEKSPNKQDSADQVQKTHSERHETSSPPDTNTSEQPDGK